MSEIQKAFDYFGLPPTASLEEVKKTYKKKIFSIHPDHNKGENTEETAKANAYYTILKNYFLEKKEPREDINQYLQQIKSIFTFHIKLAPLLTQEIKNNILNNFFEELKFAKTNESIIQCYNKYKTIFFKALVDNLNSNKIPIQINYNLDIIDFYDLLNKKLKEHFLRELNNISFKYKQYNGYEYLKDKINKMIENCRNSKPFKNNPIYYLNEIIETLDKLKKDIDNLFNTFQQNMKILLDLLKKTKYKNLLDRINQCISIYTNDPNYPIDKIITEIQNRIKEEEHISQLQGIHDDIEKNCDKSSISGLYVYSLNGKVVAVYNAMTCTISILLLNKTNSINPSTKYCWYTISSKFKYNYEKNCIIDAYSEWLTGTTGILNLNIPCLDTNYMVLAQSLYMLLRSQATPLAICSEDDDGNISFEIFGHKISFNSKDRLNRITNKEYLIKYDYMPSIDIYQKYGIDLNSQENNKTYRIKF